MTDHINFSAFFSRDLPFSPQPDLDIQTSIMSSPRFNCFADEIPAKARKGV